MPIPTLRLLAVALLGIVPIALAPGLFAAVAAALVWSGLIAGLAILDAAQLPDFGQLRWSREHDRKLSLGAWNAVTVRLNNGSKREVSFRLRDAVPPTFQVEAERAEGRCGPAANWAGPYRAYPIHRGDFTLGPLTVRYLGPFGLVWRQHTVRLDGQVKVYPNLLAIRQYESLARRGQLEEIGLRDSRRWGSGTEFERLREYSPDDEFRRINWAATARQHRLVAAEYQTERSQPILLLLDTGRAMAAQVPVEEDPLGTPPLSRLDYAVNASLLLAFVSLQRGDKVGLLSFSDRVTRFVTPVGGRRQFLRLAEALYDLEPEMVESDYGRALEYLAIRNPRRSLGLVFTDISGSDEARSLVLHLRLLARRHVPLVVTLRDPAVEQLAQQPPEDTDRLYQRAVAMAVLEEREQVLRSLRSGGSMTLDVPADKLSPALINRYLEIKGRAML